MNKKYLAVLFLFLMSCKEQAVNYETLKKLINNDLILQQHPKIILVSKMQCEGCVSDKLCNFYKDADSIENRETMFLLDTNDNKAALYVKKHFHYMYLKQDSMEKYFPSISNLVLVKTDNTRGNKVIFQKEINAPDPDIIKYY